LHLADGAQARAAVANVGGGAAAAFGLDEQVWLSWPAETAVILTH